jgi:adenylate cyclase
MSGDNAHLTIAFIRSLASQIDQANNVIKDYQGLLEQRGITIPSAIVHTLQTLRSRFSVLQKQIVNAMMELQRLRALADTTALINSTLDLDAVLERVMDTVIELTGAERGYLVLKDLETGEYDHFVVARGIELTALTNQTYNPETKRQEFVISRTVIQEVATTGQAVLTDNASNDKRYKSQQSIIGFALRSILAVPLQVRDEVIGVVYCDNRIVAGLFQPGDLDTLRAFSDQAAVAIDNARLFTQVRQQLEQITQMQDLMDNVFDSIASGVLTLDGEGIITTCNAAALQVLNIPANYSIIGQCLWDIAPQFSQDLDQMVESVRQDGVQRFCEIAPHIEGLGVRQWNVVISCLLDSENVIQGVALVVDDFTEQKQRQAQLHELRRYLPEALINNFQTVEDIHHIEGQERVITAIATDVRGFTTFSELLEPELLMEVINYYLSLASDSINLYEGIVDKYMGDAVTGLYNTQLNPQDDHAVRAVRAAMNIIYDLYALHEIMPEAQRLYYGIGIHTGSAYLGNVGSPDRQEFSALGEAVSMAKWLESNAKGGEIILSEQTYQLVKDFFDCEQRQPDNPSGRYSVDTIYKVVGRKKGTPSAPFLLDAELAELLADDD